MPLPSYGVQQQAVRGEVVAHAPARNSLGGTGFLDGKRRHCNIIAEGTDGEGIFRAGPDNPQNGSDVLVFSWLAALSDRPF